METLPKVSPKRRIVAPAATERKQAYALQIGSAVYRYDGEGNRVMKVAGGKTGIPACRRGVRRDRGVSKTPPGLAGDGLGSPSSGLFGGSEKLVEYRSNATRFYHNDHLGTTKAVTDHTGLVLERWDHYPFGEERVSGLTGDRYRYTGHLRDQETGSDYAGARYYANARGRWLSVDPVRGNMANPQRLNRYAYVLNDPVNYVDVGGGTECPALVCVTVVGAMPPDHSGYYATFYWSWRHPLAPPPTPIVPPEPPERPRFVQDTENFRGRLNTFVKHTLSDNCKNFLTAKGIDLSKILAAGAKTMFWSFAEHRDKPILSLPGVHGTFGGRTVLGDLEPKDRSGRPNPYVGAVVLKNDARNYFHHVAFGGLFTSGLHVFHEMLHIVLERTDIELAFDFGLSGARRFPDTSRGREQASQAITNFFDPEAWDCGAKIGWDPW